MKTIVYLHGFGSTGLSSTGAYLVKKMPQYRILTPDIPIDPHEAMPYLKQYCKENNADMVVGNSMGGMYAMQMIDYKRLCINPALRMSELKDILKIGIHPYLQPTKTGERHFEITPSIIDHFREMEKHFYDGLYNWPYRKGTYEISRMQCWGLFGNKDDEADYYQEFLRQFYPHVMKYNGGHRITNAILREVIIPFIKMVLDEEYTDEWGVTYCSYGRFLKAVDLDRFTCEEYTIPEGVECLLGEFKDRNSHLRIIHLPNTLKYVEANTFQSCPLEEVELPEGLTKVSEFMFEGCRKLKTVHLPSTIKKISCGAFNACTSLSSINLPDSIKTIEIGAFENCKSLSHVDLPSSVEEIGHAVFCLSGLESIDIHSRIKSIDQKAFWKCDKLRSLTIPSTVKEIGWRIVSAHEGFEGIICEAPGYHVENDALIDDNSHAMLCCWTIQKDYVIPSCVMEINDFSDNPFVETITALQFIEVDGWIARNANLRKVNFTQGVNGIERDTFEDCPKLEFIPKNFN